MAEMNWSYIAGFFDGEGYIGLGRQKHCGEGRYSRGAVRITITQTRDRGRILLEEISEFMSEFGITSNISVKDHENIKWACTYKLRMEGFPNCSKFISSVFPHLRIKKVEAQDMWRYNRAFPSLVGKGHSHADNVRKAWITRRRLYGQNGRKVDTRRA